MNKRRLIPLFTAFVLWGSQYVVSKVALRTIPPVTLLALRYLVSIPALLLVLRLRRALKPVDRRDWPILFAIGFTGYFVSVFLWSTASIIIRRISGRYDPMQIALIAICCALPLTGAWSLIELQSAACSFSVQSVLAVLYMGIFGTAVTHSLWNYSLRVMDASFCSMFYPMQPLVSAILGVLFLHETVTPSFILGALMICGGIVAAVKSAPK